MRKWVVLEKAARLVVLAATIAFCLPRALAELTAHDYSVEITAVVAEEPPEITLQWQSDANATEYKIYRKTLGDPAWQFMVAADGSRSFWRDASVARGVAYEYQIVKSATLGYSGYGYICSAVRREPIENRGKMILLIESELAAALRDEIARLQQDLVGDGWSVVQREVSKTNKPPEVKNIIRAAYDADRANTKALFLFGHIPVAYSGNISPDMHADDLGAWPADPYYAEFEGNWTDISVNNTNSSNNARSNVPGDGRFDQDQPPAPVPLQMGRVDLYNLTCFANKTPARYEVDLARNYLAKDHNFRHGVFDVQRRAMIFDRLYRGLEKEPQTCAAWRTFPGFFGRDQVRVIGQYEYFPILQNESYMWSYVVSGGSFYGSDYIGTSDDWALNEPKVVFTSFLGSWFGQWDRESDFLRAPLGTTGYTLACIFSGQPQWVLHPMSMGEPIGYSAMLTQNNPTNGLYPPQINAGYGQIHVALMGDPSLRMHIVKPPASLTGTTDVNGVRLSWSASSDPEAIGYYIYKAGSSEGPFTRISGSAPLTTTSYTDPAGDANSVYMVRALKLERNASGSYFNLSQGVFYPDSLKDSRIPDAPHDVAISAVNKGSIDITWIGASPASTRAYQIQRRTLPDGGFTRLGEVPVTQSTFADTTLSAGIYAYRVQALGFAGDSAFSGEASINLQPSWGALLGVDKITGGDWIGKYGADGYLLVGAATNLPSYLSMIPNNVATSSGPYETPDDPENLQRPDGKSRYFCAWANSHRTGAVLSFRFRDSDIHRISIYMVDWNGGVRSGTLDLIDPFTGRILGSQYFTNYTQGEYITVDARNFVDIRVASEFPERYNIWINAVFLDTPSISPTALASATFIATDTTTKGDWQTKYGSTGNAIPQWSIILPAEIQFARAAGDPWIWSMDATDVRALNKYSSDNTRVASVWYHPSEAVFDLSIASDEERQVALYFLDWDRAGRAQDLAVTDSTGKLLMQQRVENFGDGQYVVFKGKGHLQIRLRRIAGPNAVLNGIFFAPIASEQPPPPPPPPKPSQLESPKFEIATASYTMRINGSAGQFYKVLVSSDLNNWTIAGRIAISGTTADWPVPFSSANNYRFYRAMLEQ